MNKIYRALTIAGSDSSGGAGIQADLKTFAALGVYGLSAVTSITAQNTMSVTALQDVNTNLVRAQIKAVIEDIGIDAVKVGMVHTAAIIKAVTEELKKHHFPLVVDPVMVSKSQAELLEPKAVKSLVNEILPITTILTPNALEAETLTGMEIKNVEAAKKAAKKIFKLGAKTVVVKGGHFSKNNKVTDVLFYKNRFYTFETEKIDSKSTHGTGCTFSAAIAAQLAKGNDMINAVDFAQKYVTKTIKFGFSIGHGYGPVNQFATLYNECEKYVVIRNLTEAIEKLESSPEISELIPETNSNLVMALPYAESYLEVLGIPGRIVRTIRGVKASSCPRFGASRHVANTVITVMRYDSDIRAAMNIKYSKRILKLCEKNRLVTSFYDRASEPVDVKKIEGMTTRWGTEEAIRRIGRVPDILYHTGDWGKEPMITILGKNALQVASIAVNIAKEI